MYTIIIFYKFKELSAEAEERARNQWEQLKSQFEKFGIRLVSNNLHAFGTKFNGFLIVEAENFENYVQFWRWFKDRIRWYVEQTMTIIGLKKE